MNVIQWLVDLLTPVFTSMGVSEVDVQTYAESLSGYIYAIFGALVLMILVMAAAHFLVKKGTRHVVRWSAGVAWVLVVAVIANLIWPDVQQYLHHPQQSGAGLGSVAGDLAGGHPGAG